MASNKRYVLIDHGGVLETYKDKPSEDDLILKDLDGLYQVLENAPKVIQALNRLEQFNISIAFHSKSGLNEQLGLYKSLLANSKAKGMKFPEVVAMAVYNSQAYKSYKCDDPYIITNADPKIIIAGYQNDLKGKACIRKALQKALGIPDFERNEHYVLDDVSDNTEAAQNEGWQTFLINEGMTLENAINEICDKAEQESKEQKKYPIFIPEYLIRLYRKPACHELFQLELTKDIKHFKLSVKPRPESECLSAGVFREVIALKDQCRKWEPKEWFDKEWIGECYDPFDKEYSEIYAYKQKLASDFYCCFAFNAPKVEMSTQTVCHVEGYEDSSPRMYTMSEIFLDLQTYKDYCGKNFNLTNPNPNGNIISSAGKEFPEEGLGQILAVAFFINDFEPFWQRGEHIGIIMGEFFAKTYKIRYVGGFDTPIFPEKPRTIRVGPKADQVIEFDKLPPRTKEEFLLVTQKILIVNEEEMKKFFTRKYVEKFGAYEDKGEEFLLKMVLERQEKLRTYYEEDLKILEKYIDRFVPIAKYY